MHESTGLDNPIADDDSLPAVDPPPARITPRGLSIAGFVLVEAIFTWTLLPKFTEIFADFDVAVPVVTNLFLTPPPWVIPSALVAIAVIVVLKDLVLTARTCRWINRAVIFCAVVYLVAFLFGMFAPLANLIEGLNP